MGSGPGNIRRGSIGDIKRDIKESVVRKTDMEKASVLFKP